MPKRTRSGSCPSPACRTRAHVDAACASECDKSNADKAATETPLASDVVAEAGAAEARAGKGPSPPSHRSPDSILASVDEMRVPAMELPAPAAASAPPMLLREPTASELESLECPVCFEAMQPPFVVCANEHPVCGACRPSFEREECPICRADVSDGATRSDEKLGALAAALHLRCTNGCGALLPYAAARAHEAKACALAPRLCPWRDELFLGAAGWAAGGACECRGLDAAELPAHLEAAHGCVRVPLDKLERVSPDGEAEAEGERSCSWTLQLPLPPQHARPPTAAEWGAPSTHAWPGYLVTRADGKAFLVRCIAARHAGLAVLVLGLSPGAAGMRVEAQVQGVAGEPPPYVWLSRALPADALKPNAPAEETARLLRRAVAFPEAALEFGAGKGGVLKIALSIRADEEDDSDDEIDDDTFEFIWMPDGGDNDDDDGDGDGEARVELVDGAEPPPPQPAAE